MDFLTEKLELVNKETNDEKQIEALRRVKTPALMGILKINFNEDVDMGLPEGVPGYKLNAVPPHINHSYLETEYRQVFRIWLGDQTGISSRKKEAEFIAMLERLHPTEAELILLTKDHKLSQKYPNIRKENVVRAYWDANYVDEKRPSKDVGDTIVIKETDDGVKLTKEIDDNIDIVEDTFSIDENIEKTLKDYIKILKSIEVQRTTTCKLLGIKYPALMNNWKNGKYPEFGEITNQINALQIVNVLYRMKQKGKKTNKVINLFTGK